MQQDWRIATFKDQALEKVPDGLYLFSGSVLALRQQRHLW